MRIGECPETRLFARLRTAITRPVGIWVLAPALLAWANVNGMASTSRRSRATRASEGRGFALTVLPEMGKGWCGRRGHWPRSRYWDWRKEVAVLQGMLANPGFSIVCDGLTQGMMIVDTVKHRGRIDDQRGQHLVCVEFVENAPWNQAELFDPPRCRGIGSILIRAAVALSRELEFHGRIGLHSLPPANGFYANTCGMTDLGVDPDHEDLRYFEMTPDQARAFIAKGEAQ